MDKTTLVFSDNKHALYGRDVHRVTFADMHMTRKDYTVSQGLVNEVAAGRARRSGLPRMFDIFSSIPAAVRITHRAGHGAAQGGTA